MTDGKGLEELEIIAYLICKDIAGTLSDEEKALLDQWRRASDENEKVYQRLHNADLLDKEQRRSALVDFHRPLNDMKRQLGLEHVAPVRHSRRRWLVAASVALLILGGLMFRWLDQSGPAPSSENVTAQKQQEIRPGKTVATLTYGDGQQVVLTDDDSENQKIMRKTGSGHPAKMNSLTTPRGGEFKVTLEDGTEVWLNAASKLVYPETFGDRERRVELEGEAYFKVAKNEKKPFFVVAGSQEIRVYGTEFDVDAYEEEDEILTTLVKGSVSLKSLHAVQGEVVLSPGHQAVFSQSTESARVRKVDTDVVTSWRKGMFVFENQTMAQIMRQLSRWYDFDYKFADPNVAQIEFMGTIPRYSSFHDVAEVLRKAGGIKLSQNGRTIIVSAE
ncbi:MAG: FecR family protein [Prevotella sp.]|jgi:transmembrane sensor